METWSRLRKHAADIIAWTNDIHSVAKDVVCGERFNLVSILAHTAGLDWPGAIEAAHQMVNTAVAQFTAAATEHAHYPPCAATDPDRLRQVVRAAGTGIAAFRAITYRPMAARYSTADKWTWR